MTSPGFLQAHKDRVLLAVRVQPRASRNEIGAPLGDELRIKVTAPLVNAAANEALLRRLADTLDCPRGTMHLVRGHTSRHKMVLVQGLGVARLREKLIA